MFSKNCKGVLALQQTQPLVLSLSAVFPIILALYLKDSEFEDCPSFFVNFLVLNQILHRHYNV